MRAVQSLQESFSVVKRNPILVLVGLLMSVVVGILGLVPLIGPIANIFVVPFMLGGLLGVASKALDGDVEFGDFVSSAKEHYTKLLGASLILGLVYASGVFAVAITAVIGSFSMGMSSSPSSAIGGASPSLLGTPLLLMVAAFFLAFVLVGFLLQFFAVAIVVGGTGATGSFAQSYRVVRENVVSTLAYVVLRIALGVAIFVPAVAGVFVGGALGDSTGGFAVTAFFGLFSLLFGVVGSAVFPTFQAAFYRDHLDLTAAAE